MRSKVLELVWHLVCFTGPFGPEMTTGRGETGFYPVVFCGKILAWGDFFKKTKGERPFFLQVLELEHPSHIHGWMCWSMGGWCNSVGFFLSMNPSIPQKGWRQLKPESYKSPNLTVSGWMAHRVDETVFFCDRRNSIFFRGVDGTTPTQI